MRRKSLALFFVMTLMISMSMMVFTPSVKALVSIGHIKPDHGPVGTLVEIVGVADVAAPNTVSILWDGTWLTQANVDADKNWVTTFNVPRSVAGEHQVTAKDDTSGLSVSRPFTVESEILISPIQGSVGTSVTVTGTGFAGNSLVSITYDGVQVAADYTDDVGNFSEGFYVPPSKFGGHTVAATDEDGNSDDAIFKVDPATLELTATSGPVGTTVGVTGYGFSGLASVEVDLEGTPVFGDGDVDTKETDATGSFSFDYTFPETTAGYYTFTAEDEDNHIARAVFQIIPNIDVDPDHGAVNDEIVATGTGFAGIASVDVYFDGIRIWGDMDVTTNETDDVGSFQFAFTVPNVAPGFYTVVATDEYGNVATADFVVGPWLVLSMDHGHVGMSVTATGYVFTPSSSVDLTFGGITVATGIMTDAYGDFYVALFNVPEVTQGTYVVMASDDEGVSASASFTVYPWITISPTSGTVGTTVTVSGTGFAADADGWIRYMGVSDNPEDISDPQCVETWDGTYRWYIVTVGQWTTVSTVLTNEKGSFETTFNVPESWGGYHPIEAFDEYENVANEQVFRVLPKIWIEPSSGVSGQYVTVYGTGFSAYEYYRKFTDVNHDGVRDLYGEEWVYSRGVDYCGENLVIFGKLMGEGGFPEFNTGFVLDFGLNLRYIDELQYVLNNEADVEWAICMYEPVLINQKGTIVYMGRFVIQNGSPFLQVPFLQPGDYTVTAYRFNYYERLDHYYPSYPYHSWWAKSREYSYDESASTTFTIEPLEVDVPYILEHLNELKAQIEGVILDSTEGILLAINTSKGDIIVKLDDVKEQIEAKLLTIEGDLATITTNLGLIQVDVDAIQAKLVDIQGDLATISTTLGEIEVKLDDIDAKLTSIEEGVATIETAIGEIEIPDLSAIDAKLTSIEGNIATIQTDIGTVQTGISDINLRITSIEGSIATIETDIGTIEGKITAIEGDMATIETDVGTIEADLPKVTEATESVESATALSLPISILLSAIAAIGAVAACILISRKLKLAS